MWLIQKLILDTGEELQNSNKKQVLSSSLHLSHCVT